MKLVYKCNYDGKVCGKVVPKIDKKGRVIDNEPRNTNPQIFEPNRGWIVCDKCERCGNKMFTRGHIDLIGEDECENQEETKSEGVNVPNSIDPAFTCRTAISELAGSDTVLIYEGAHPLGRSIVDDILDDDEYNTAYDYDFRDWPVENFDVYDDLAVIHLIDPKN